MESDRERVLLATLEELVGVLRGLDNRLRDLAAVLERTRPGWRRPIDGPADVEPPRHIDMDEMARRGLVTRAGAT